MRFNLWIIREDSAEVILYGNQKKMTALASAVAGATAEVLPDLEEPLGFLGSRLPLRTLCLPLPSTSQPYLSPPWSSGLSC
jgi:hypothetical protein